MDDDIGLEWIDVRQCEDCGAWLEETGPDGIVAHAMDVHPVGRLASDVRAALVGAPPSDKMAGQGVGG